MKHDNDETSVNQITVSGLLQGLVHRQTAKGDKVSNGTLVLINGFRENRAARQQFIRVTLWRGLAVKAAGFAPNSKVRVSGRIETELWTDQSGNKKSKMVIVAHSLAPISHLLEVPEEKTGKSSPEPSGEIGGREAARAILAPPDFKEANSAAN